MGIAIVAVPTGILGAGFTEAIEERNKQRAIEENADNLRNGFERKLDSHTGFKVVKQLRTVDYNMARLDIKTDDLSEEVS